MLPSLLLKAFVSADRNFSGMMAIPRSFGSFLGANLTPWR
jgi:hypothetical protein